MSDAAVIELIATLGAPQPIDEDWVTKARCPETDPEVFFPDERGGSTKDAKKVCQGCPVKDPCLQWALDNKQRFGVWGGLSERERLRLQQSDNECEPDSEIAAPHALPAIAALAEDYQDARLAG